MIDRRLYPANAFIAHASLRGEDLNVPFTEGVQKSVTAVVADLFAKPGQGRERQRLLGEVVTKLEDRDGWAFVICDDGYVGYIASDLLGDSASPTHRVATFATHAYTDENMKSPELCDLPFGAQLKVLDERRKFFETDQGFIPKTHLRPLDRPFEDPATIAALHFNVPYLWGGNSTGGIDCSGLIAASLRACGMECPADSDMQCALGVDVTGSLKRGDLVFWDGHVGMMMDDDVLCHANAHHMACRYEGLDQAILRIKAQGDGDVFARRRLA